MGCEKGLSFRSGFLRTEHFRKQEVFRCFFSRDALYSIILRMGSSQVMMERNIAIYMPHWNRSPNEGRLRDSRYRVGKRHD